MDIPCCHGRTSGGMAMSGPLNNNTCKTMHKYYVKDRHGRTSEEVEVGGQLKSNTGWRSLVMI